MLGWPQSRGVSATVAAASGQRTPLFFSNHSTALGSGDAALLDTSKAIPWTQHGGGTNQLAVVSAAGKDMPTTNCLEVQHRTGAPSFYWLTCNNIWAAPANNGDSISFRDYLRVEIGDGEGNTAYANTHPWESEGGTGSVNGQFYARHYGGYSNGTYPSLFAVDQASFPFTGWTPGGNSDPLHPGDPMPLDKFRTYMTEWKWTRRGATSWDLDMRISAGGVLLFDRNSIKAWGGSSGQTLANNGQNLTVDVAHIQMMRVGLNGGFTASALQRVYWGGFGVAYGDFIGPYGNLVGEV